MKQKLERMMELLNTMNSGGFNFSNDTHQKVYALLKQMEKEVTHPPQYGMGFIRKEEAEQYDKV